MKLSQNSGYSGYWNSGYWEFGKLAFGILAFGKLYVSGNSPFRQCFDPERFYPVFNRYPFRLIQDGTIRITNLLIHNILNILAEIIVYLELRFTIFFSEIISFKIFKVLSGSKHQVKDHNPFIGIGYYPTPYADFSTMLFLKHLWFMIFRSEMACWSSWRYNLIMLGYRMS